MINPAKWYLYQAEKAAYEDSVEAGYPGVPPDPNAAITFERLWDVCVRYLGGSLYSEPDHGENFYFIYVAPTNNSDCDEKWQ